MKKFVHLLTRAAIKLIRIPIKVIGAIFKLLIMLPPGRVLSKYLLYGNTKYVELIPQGGIGNQMFQYATARALSLHHNLPLILDSCWFSNTPTTATHREYFLPKLPICATQTNSDADPFSRFKQRMRVFRAKALGKFRKHVEIGLNYHSEIWNIRPPLLLKGYYQSPKYFEHRAQIIRQELEIATDLVSSDYQNKYREFAKSPFTALHVRGTDYLTLDGYERVGTQYYTKALATVGGELPIAVFSDDLPYAKNTLPTGYDYTFITGGETLDDLWLMTRAHHHIIPNSTYSWWGAWLSEDKPSKKGGMTIAPKIWLELVKNAHDHITPDHWCKI